MDKQQLDRLAAALVDRYRIERELGTGGMATVFLAHDLKHDRKVAIKVLRPELAAVIGADRFLSEIKTTANLQHPHILPLFDSGAADSFLFYVMPYVEGESLRDRLSREKQLPVGDAVRIASEVASALDYAHRHGVIHRDIKPENILLHDGQALVADFGIALAVHTVGKTRMTESGMSLGTPHYMSPEQAMGEREINARSDIYALGCVTYEMLVGEPPFTGPTAQSIVAKVMTEPARSLTGQRRTIPTHVEDAVLTALEKLPADRFSSTADFATMLNGQAAPSATLKAGAARRALKFRTRVQLGVALGVVAMFAFVGGYGTGRRPLPPLEVGRSVQVTSDPGLEVQPALSPDGRSVAYAGGTSGGTRIYVRQVAGGRATPISDDSTDSEDQPHWSPDGSRILFLSRGGAFSAPASGGPVRQELPAGNGSAIGNAAWGPDGQTIAYTIGDSLFVRDPAGSSRLVAHIVEPSLCSWAPDAKQIACASGNALYLAVGVRFGNLSPSRIVICRVADGLVATISDSFSLNQSPIWSADGKWLYYVSTRFGPGDIYAQRITGSGKASGPPVRLTTGLGAQSISLSADGRRLAYGEYAARSNIWSLPLPTAGPVTSALATPLTSGTQVIEAMTVSHDGKWLLFDSDRSGNSDIYRMPIGGGEPERLTSDSAAEFSADLSPDGTEFAFHSWRAGSRDIFVQPLDGRPLQRVTSTPAQELVPRWSPDGKELVVTVGTGLGSFEVIRRRSDGGWEPGVMRARGVWPVWSPDGREFAYSTSTIPASVAVIPVDSGAPRIVMDATKPGMPSSERLAWSTDGRTIYFKSHDTRGRASFWSVPAAGGAPRQLVRFDDPARPSYRPQWALGPGRIYFTVEDRQSDVWVMEVAPQ
jgi:serine/threonine-protein kinase